MVSQRPGGQTCGRMAFFLSLFSALFVLAARSSLGQGFVTLHSFSHDAGRPGSRPVADASGRLVGTTLEGGLFGKGSVYVVAPMPGGGFARSTIYSFSGADGSAPVGELVLGDDGLIYGLCGAGGGSNSGSFFRVDPNDLLTTLHDFTPGEGSPAGFMQASDGLFYGTNATVGGSGGIFRIDRQGLGFEFVHLFTAGEGVSPQAALVEANDHSFYGTTYYGGDNSVGTMFHMTPSGVVTTLYSFGAGASPTGAWPKAPLLLASNGSLYGTTNGGTFGADGSVFRSDLDGNVEMIHVFNGVDGEVPVGVLLEVDGFVYGTTGAGGAAGDGTVFRVEVAPEGFETVHSFSGPDGRMPVGGLTRFSDGRLYGATVSGDLTIGGSVFALDGSAVLTTVADFGPFEGRAPTTPLLVGSDGLLYGTTGQGGDFFRGTIFRVDAARRLTTLHSMREEEGASPGRLLEARDGRFYGVAGAGGLSSNGTVFRMTRSGEVDVLHSFSYTDGAAPTGGLVEGDDGVFFGTTQSGGSQVSGTVFRIDATGAFATIHNFNSDDGNLPSGSLVRGDDGAFYGTTASGGAHAGGTLFRVDTKGSLTTLHEFDFFTDGSAPRGGLLQAPDGYFYGTTDGGNGGAILFRDDGQASFDVLAHAVVPNLAYLMGDLAIGGDGKIYGSPGPGLIRPKPRRTSFVSRDMAKLFLWLLLLLLCWPVALAALVALPSDLARRAAVSNSRDCPGRPARAGARPVSAPRAGDRRPVLTSGRLAT